MQHIFYQGAPAVPFEYTSQLLAIGPVVSVENTTDYPGLAVIDNSDTNSSVCHEHNTSNMIFPISIKSYNIQAQRAVFDAFGAFTADTTFNTSIFLFEGYSMQAVKAMPSESTAFPHRADNLLIYVNSLVWIYSNTINFPSEHQS
jgi:hypothetical protein